MDRLGNEHPSTLTSMANLAATYRNQGRWKEAEELEVQVMETFKRVLGEEHPDTLTSMANLAYIWKEERRQGDAVHLMEDCARRRQQSLGVEHPDTISSISALTVWRDQLERTCSQPLRRSNSTSRKRSIYLCIPCFK
ncbi:kinesin light chain [Colletotrichum truncatum]|uniref:Kinesin light chain n=1 Tax=Colletotrichum truncatum TaxID=5467 RepID=A0ACC3YCJ4_COLTU|nr:kinesin light chain [Colletotrichum truncatum]KAF6794071.1 kinesin light chain [Colletotrichum truncatum]